MKKYLILLPLFLFITNSASAEGYGVNAIQKVPYSSTKQINWCLLNGSGQNFTSIDIREDSNGFKYASTTIGSGTDLETDHDPNCPVADQNANFQLPIPLPGEDDGYGFWTVTSHRVVSDDFDWGGAVWYDHTGATESHSTSTDQYELYSNNGNNYYLTYIAGGLEDSTGEGVLKEIEDLFNTGTSGTPARLYYLTYTSSNLYNEINSVQDMLDLLQEAQDLELNNIIQQSISRVNSFDPSGDEVYNPVILATEPDIVEYTFNFTYNNVDSGIVNQIVVEFENLEDDTAIYEPAVYNIPFPTITNTYQYNGLAYLEPGYYAVTVYFKHNLSDEIWYPEVYYFTNMWSRLYLLNPDNDLNDHPVLDALVNGSSTVPGLTQIFASTTPTGGEDCTQYPWWSNPFQRLGCSLSETVIGGIKDIFIPKQQNWIAIQNQLKTSIAYKFPIGYVTRTYDILSTEATSSLPALSITFTGDSPVSGTYGFDMNQVFADASTFMDETTSYNGIVEADEEKSVWDIVMPVVNFVVYMTLLFLILGDVINFQLVPRYRVI